MSPDGVGVFLVSADYLLLAENYALSFPANESLWTGTKTGFVLSTLTVPWICVMIPWNCVAQAGVWTGEDEAAVRIR